MAARVGALSLLVHDGPQPGRHRNRHLVHPNGHPVLPGGGGPRSGHRLSALLGSAPADHPGHLPAGHAERVRPVLARERVPRGSAVPALSGVGSAAGRAASGVRLRGQ
uniref:(northern house mosquito) hypothetical protein n=1 Tax=Culex pipiens TaxID=7175 RepID=A0A8D8CKE8_CULPI